MQLEVSNCQFGVGVKRQAWPKTRHFIVQVGRVEARVIVDKERRAPWAAITLLLLSGLILGR